MCTILLTRDELGRLVLTSNRDEKRTRARAVPPRAPVELARTTALYPIDADALGTWVGVNAHGLVITLLNNYQQSASFHPDGEPVTRGRLIPALLEHTTFDRAAAALAVLDALPRTRPFIIAMAHVDAPDALVASWDGHELALERRALPLMLTSSSVDLESATSFRLDQLEDHLDGVATLEELDAITEHFIGLPTQPFGVFMSRLDAWTVSHTRVIIDEVNVQMTYTDLLAIPAEVTTVQTTRQ